MHLSIINMKEIESFAGHVGLAHGQSERVPELVPLIVRHMVNPHVVERWLNNGLRKVRRHHNVVRKAIGSCV